MYEKLSEVNMVKFRQVEETELLIISTGQKKAVT